MERLTKRVGDEVHELAWAGEILHRLAEYEDAEEAGLIKRFPCKVGTTLYFIATEEDENVCTFKYGVLESNNWIYVIDKNGEITIEDNEYSAKFEYTYDYIFGENVFLTKPEAQTALKELQNEAYKMG